MPYAIAAGVLERVELEVEVLLGRGDARVADRVTADTQWP
jgi:hypothetical protein